MKYAIGEYNFKNQKEIIEFVRKILYKYNIEDTINEEDFDFIYSLIQNHRWKEDKIGCGIEKFKIILTEYNNRAFKIIRSDGTETDFSFMKCISKPKDWRYHDFISACRTCISSQIQDFKERELTKENKCPYRNIMLDKTNSHVDHIPPSTFKNIVKRFINEKEIDVNNIEIGGYEDNATSKFFVDDELSKSFFEFHKNNAKLRLVSARANLSEIKKEV
jgi:hypothetical protein